MEDQVDRPAVGVGRWGVVGLLKHFAAGGVGGVLNVFAGHPLDTIKVEASIIHTWEARPERSPDLHDCLAEKSDA